MPAQESIVGIKDLWVAVHHHRHGTDVFFVRSDHEPLEDELVKACDIDFEPEREEYIDIEHVANARIHEI